MKSPNAQNQDMDEKVCLPEFSFIICTCNAEQRIERCLHAIIEAGRRSPVSWEVVLVDNNSSDETVSRAIAICELNGASKHLVVVSEYRPGTCFARPTGLRACRSKYFSFVDDDNLVAVNWIEQSIKILSKSKPNIVHAGVNEGLFETAPPRWFHDFESMIAVGRSPSIDNRSPLATTWTAGMTAHTATVLEAINMGNLLTTGPQGDRLTRGEDIELCFRLHFKGCDFRIADELRLQHCIPARRLDWIYLEKLAAGNGLGAPFLLLYIAILKGKPWGGHPASQICYYTFRTVKIFLTSPRVALVSVTGSKLRIQWVSTISALRTVFLNYLAILHGHRLVLKMHAASKPSLASTT